jgi:organic radical activating enzyme
MNKFYQDRFFCVAPWTGMYYHVDDTSPCHMIKHTGNPIPSDYLKSDWLKNIKKDFVDGKVPAPCRSCKEREDLGLKSTRKAVMHDVPESAISELTKDTETRVGRLEIRASNLCNFKCRMCDETSSSEIAKEKLTYLPIKLTNTVNRTTEFNINELKNIALGDIYKVCLTGGEPMLIKEYYDFLEYLINQGLNKQIALELFTNCSVYNPKFIDLILQFNKVDFVMSIDGVGKTAEYQRHGTKWEIVENNILKFNKLPKTIYFNTAISAYVLLDVSSLAKFLMKLYNDNNNIATKCYSVMHPRQLNFLTLNKELRKIAINQIDQAVNILTPDNFNIFTKELMGIKSQLERNPPENPEQFVIYTKHLDKLRNENFKDVFGYQLY